MSDGKNGEDTRRRVKKAEEVFERYGDEIRAIIEFSVKDKQITEDVFQNLFLYVVENPIPQGMEGVRGYIYKVIMNDVIDRTRRARVRQEGVKRYAEYRRYNAFQTGPQSVVIIAEEVERTLQMIEDRLSPRHARALLQCYGIRRITSRKGAKPTKIDKRRVSQYLSEALRKMRRLVLENGGSGLNLEMQA